MRGSQSERNWKRFLKWIQDNLANPDDFYKIDWDTEVDRTLTFNEAVELVIAEYPGL